MSDEGSIQIDPILYKIYTKPDEEGKNETKQINDNKHRLEFNNIIKIE